MFQMRMGLLFNLHD